MNHIIKKTIRRFNHEMNKPITDSSGLSVPLLITASFFTVIVLIFGFIFLLDYFERFAKWIVN